mmetsp:Transcript_46191/g.86177  ORF Transcript_46191/g.86177 Transcript_46191/m.86177 type:complete len:108 (+) Transcript_46191:73-396(+)
MAQRFLEQLRQGVLQKFHVCEQPAEYLKTSNNIPAPPAAQRTKAPAPRKALPNQDGGLAVPVILLNGVKLELDEGATIAELIKRRTKARSRLHGPALEWSRQQLAGM